jgi:nitrate reductase NapE
MPRTTLVAAANRSTFDRNQGIGNVGDISSYPKEQSDEEAVMADLAQSDNSTARNGARGAEKQREWLLFLFLTVVLAPMVAVAVVGGYGFLVWMYQLIAGPPGPPAL